MVSSSKKFNSDKTLTVKFAGNGTLFGVLNSKLNQKCAGGVKVAPILHKNGWDFGPQFLTIWERQAALIL